MRFDDPLLVDLMNDLYENEWSYFFNFFIPSVKLVSKERIEAKQKSKHDNPKTPFQRLLESGDLKGTEKQRLIRISKSMNPFILQKQIEIKIKNILKYACGEPS